MTPARTALLLLFGCALTGLACRGPEYAPHAPVTGVDRPYPEDEEVPPQDELPAQTRATPPAVEVVKEFVAQVATEARDERLVIAVFPALATHPDGTRVVNGLGEFLMHETARQLEERLERALVVSGEELAAALPGGFDALCSEADAQELAAGMEATHAIFGTVERTVTSGIQNESVLSVRWRCRRITDSELVATLDLTELGAGPLARDLFQLWRRPSGIDVCTPRADGPAPGDRLRNL